MRLYFLRMRYAVTLATLLTLCSNLFNQSMAIEGNNPVFLHAVTLSASNVNQPTSSIVSQYSQKRHLVPDHQPTALLSYTQEPLGNRQPLILVHGIGGTDYAEWGDFLRYVKQRPDFEKRFKIYLFHYDSSKGVEFLSLRMQHALKTFLAELPSDRKIKLVGYSEGGLLVRNVMKDSEINSHVEQVITMATPFHGSPLASKSWFTAQVRREPLLAPLRISRRIAYWVAAKRFPSFEKDFHWDNVDEAIDKTFSILPADLQSLDLVDTTTQTTGHEDGALEHSGNFITYGSFFGTSDEIDAKMLQSLELKAKLPHERIGILTKRRFVFNVVNRSFARIGRALTQAQLTTIKSANKKQLSATNTNHANTQVNINNNNDEAKVLLAVAAPKESGEPASLLAINSDSELGTLASLKDISDAGSVSLVDAVSTDDKKTQAILASMSMMPFNDGISPISSSLWLGRFSVQSKTQDPMNRLWEALRYLKGKDQARLFPGLDHQNWVNGQTRMATKQVPDLLNPQQEPKTVFDWLISDLMATR